MMIKVGFVKLENYPENIEVEGKMVAPTWQFAHKGDAYLCGKIDYFRC